MANRFWVGGAGTWDASSTANWSASSGGASGASAPTTSDAVLFDANSGSGTVTAAAGATCSTCSINNSGISIQLTANVSFANAITLTSGTLDLNGNQLTADSIVSTAANARTLAFGATGKFVATRTASATYAIDLFNATVNLTLTGTPIWEFTGNFAVTSGIRGSATTVSVGDVYVKSGTGTFNLAGGFRCGTVDFTGFSGTLAVAAIDTVGDIVFSTGMTITGGSSVMSFLKSSGTQKLTTNGKTFDRPITVGSASASPTLALQDNLTMGNRTFTLTAGTVDLTANSGNWILTTGIFTSSNTNIRSISFGTGRIDVIGSGITVWQTGNMTNFSYTGTSKINLTYSGGTGTRTVGPGATAVTEAKVLNFYVTAGTDTVDCGDNVGTLDFTGFSGTLFGRARTLYGDLVTSSGMTITGTATATSFVSTTKQQNVTTNGKTLDFAITVNKAGRTLQFQDALTQGSTRAFTLTNGTVQLKNGVTSTVGVFATSGTNQKFLQSTSAGSQATISQASGTVNASYLTIQDSNATGGATWLAYVDQQNVDNGNNDGWDFGISPVVGGAEYTYRLRSFTEMRQF